MKQALAELYPGSRTRDIITSAAPGWSVLNPSIAQGPEGYKCIVRSSNFVERNGEYLVADPENIVRTKNYLCELDDKLRITSMDIIDTSEVEPEVKFTLVRNMEDARLFYSGGCWWASGTSREHRNDGVPKIALDRLSLRPSPRSVERSYMDGPDPYLCEKNWMPLVGTESPIWVYSCNPSAITDGSSKFPGGGFEGDADLRGSSQVIPVNDGEFHVGVTHEVTFIQSGSNWQRQYWHRLVKFDESGFLLGMGEPFYFMAHGIEFANGIVEWNDQLVVSFGFRDERAMLAFIPKEPALRSI